MNGNHTMNYGEAGNCAAMQETPFRRLTNSVELLAEARGRLARVTDMMVGQEPPQPTTAGHQQGSVGCCLFDEVENAASAVHAIATRIFEDINRIERRL